MKLQVKLGMAVQSAVPETGKPEVKTYYLVLGENEKKVVVNIGEKTFDKIKKLQDETATEEQARNTTTETNKPGKNKVDSK